MCVGARISSLSDAVRVARSYDRANRSCVVVECFGNGANGSNGAHGHNGANGTNGAHGHNGAYGASGNNDFGSNVASTPHWHIIEHKSRVLDPIMIDGACDAMRALPPIEWDGAYEAAVARVARRKIRTLIAPRGVDFWREYYGVPRRSTEQLVKEHNKSHAQWDPARVIAPMNEQQQHVEYRHRVCQIVRKTARWLATRLRSMDREFDARLVKGAFSLIAGRNGVDAVLVKKSGSPLAGAMYPLHTLGSLRGRASWKFVEMLPKDLDHVNKNERVLVVGVLDDDPALASLLIHEISHAITLPLWTDANHPRAFSELETIVAECPEMQRLSAVPAGPLAPPVPAVPVGPSVPAVPAPQAMNSQRDQRDQRDQRSLKQNTRRLSALARAFIEARVPSPPRSEHPRASSSQRAGSRRSP